MDLFKKIFKKKPQPTTTELKCPVAGCSFTSSNPVALKRHMDWKHPELANTADK